MSITRVEFFCDDKRVGDALRRLVGIAIGKPEATPVINTEQKPNGQIAQATANGTMTDLYIAHIKKHRLKEVSVQAAREFLSESGVGSPASAGHMLKNLKKRKMIRLAADSPKAGYRVRYRIMPAAFKAEI